MRRVPLALALAVLAMTPARSVAESWSLPPADYVYQPSPGCIDDPQRAQNGGGRLPSKNYQVCEDQMASLVRAMDVARRDGKLLLVSLGATWCTWCSAFQRLLPTEEGLGKQGDEIDFEAVFHTVEIGVSTLYKGQRTRIPSGQYVQNMLLARAQKAKLRAIPFIFVIDPNDSSRVWARNLDDLAIPDHGEHDMGKVRAVLVEAHDVLRKGKTAAGEPGWLERKLRRWRND